MLLSEMNESNAIPEEHQDTAAVAETTGNPSPNDDAQESGARRESTDASGENGVRKDSEESFLPEEFRADPALAKFKTAADLCKSYKMLQGMIGRKTVARPDENSTPEEWAQWHHDNGVPDDPADYKLEDELDAELPENLCNDAMKTQYREIFKAANLTDRQAEALWKLRNQYVQKELAGRKAAAESARAAGEDALRKEWGDDFQVNLNKAFAVFRKLCPGQNVQTHPLADHPEFVKILAAAFPAFADDTMVIRHGSTATAAAAVTERISAIQENPAYRNPAHPDHERLRREMIGLMEKKRALSGKR